MRVEFFDIRDAARMERALAIRTRVFVDEQHVPLDEEIDDHDRSDQKAVHALIQDDEGNDLGAGRYYTVESGAAQIGRMAIEKAHRSKGAGKRLLEALMEEAKKRGHSKAKLDAQIHARTFYIKSGFYDEGEKLWDAGIEHQPMSRQL